MTISKSQKKNLFRMLGLTVATLIGYFSVRCLFNLQAAWYWRYASLIALGHILSLGMLHVATPHLLFRLSSIPLCSPNWLSIDRAPIILLGQVLFIGSEGRPGLLLTGFLLVVFGLILDRIDGCEAKSNLASLKFVPQANHNSGRMANSTYLWAWYSVEEENDQGEKVLVDRRVIMEDWIFNLSPMRTIVPMFRLQRDFRSKPPALRLLLTHYGDWIDPLSDKSTMLPLLCFLLSRDMFYWPVVVLAVILDLFSTIIREPFQNWPGFRVLQKYTRESKASPFGKTKMIWQILSLLAIIPAASNWLSPAGLHTSKQVASCLLGLGDFAGALSIASRLTFWNSLVKAFGLRRVYKRFQKSYEHEVEEELK